MTRGNRLDRQSQSPGCNELCVRIDSVQVHVFVFPILIASLRDSVSDSKRSKSPAKRIWWKHCVKELGPYRSRSDYPKEIRFSCKTCSKMENFSENRL